MKIPATAILVSRDQADADMVLGNLLDKFEEVLFWNNETGPADLKVFGRYALAATTKYTTIYFQDDDCLVDVEKLWLCYGEDRGAPLCNMPEEHRAKYPDGIALVGFGCFTDLWTIRRAFSPYLAKYPIDELFLIECDRVFTALAPHSLALADVPMHHLANARLPTSLYRRPDHASRLAEIRRRIAIVKGAGQ